VQVQRVLAASNEILDECLACGGSVTGEHGIGVEKIGFMSKIVLAHDLAAMKNLRDAFNPRGNLSPDKMLPTRRRLRNGAEALREGEPHCESARLLAGDRDTLASQSGRGRGLCSQRL